MLAALPELETIKSVHDRLRTLRGRLAELRARLSTEAWTEAELRWRRAFARELRRLAASPATGEHQAGDPFLIGFNLATQRVTSHLLNRADEIAG